MGVSENITTIFDTNFVVCDVETTGLSPVHNRITEIALIRIQGNEITEKFSTLINPKQHIPAFITAMTGIRDDDVVNKPDFEGVSEKIHNFIFNGNENLVFCGHNASFDYKFLKESFLRCKNELPFELPVLCTCKLARRLLRKLRSKSLSSVAKYFGLKQVRGHRAYDDALVTARILLKFLDMLQEDYDYEYIEDVIKFQNKKIYSAQSKSPALKRINLELKNIPERPGVYYMLSSSGEILYIGKAKNLRERVSTYFHHNSELPPKIKKLLTNIRRLEYEETNSELSALILESRLIKQHKPRFNTAIKRYRHHPFLKIDIQNEFPKIESVYEIENDGAYYYGPFVRSTTVRTLIKDIYDKFRLRKCEPKNLKYSPKNSNCMYYDIDKCDAPCIGNISKEKYAEEVVKVHNYLTETDINSAQFLLRQEMEKHSEELNFEKAAYIRDRLFDLNKVMSNQKVITSAINDKKIIIKCDYEEQREIFFIQNGKLINTYLLKKNDESDQTNILQDLCDNTEYLYFSLNKYTKHRYTQQELDEIKVISNWLARSNGNSTHLELQDFHTREDIIKFIIT